MSTAAAATLSAPSERRSLLAAAVPYGSLVMIATLPLLVYYMWMCLEYNGGALILPRSLHEVAQLVHRIPLPTWRSVAITAAWFGWQVLLHLVVPGPWKEGIVLADGKRLQYRMNGWRALWLTAAALTALVVSGAVKPTLLADEFGPLLTTINILTFGFAGFLYVFGKVTKQPGHSTGNAVYDFWMGVTLNPRIGRFDFKFFGESRPGLLGWAVLDLSLLAKQWAVHGTVSTPMVLVCAFQVFYVIDYFWNEEAILTTLDIMHENLGFMLLWGCLVWVPFTYTIQAYYLMQHTHDLPLWSTVALVILNFGGYVIFRGANIQKHKFRKDSTALVWGQPAQFIQTRVGSKLLVSGWWGLARHINYLGDILMAAAWCLPAGFTHVLPYFYVTYFGILLLHRERRDHTRCAAKYRADWDEYCRRVPRRIIPGLY